MYHLFFESRKKKEHSAENGGLSALDTTTPNPASHNSYQETDLSASPTAAEPYYIYSNPRSPPPQSLTNPPEEEYDVPRSPNEAYDVPTSRKLGPTYSLPRRRDPDETRMVENDLYEDS